MVFLLRILSVIVLVTAVSCQRDNRGLVVGKIHKASKLATTEFTIDKIVHGTKTKKLGWFIKLSEARFIAYSKAKVTSGINLQNLGKDDIVIEDQSIFLRLPAIEVLNFSYPPADFLIDNTISDNGWASKITVFDQEEFFRQAELDIRNNLQHMGIVETTQQKTRNMLTVLLRSLGYEEVYIEFESNDLIIDKVPLIEEEA
ncbi:MAG: hypothetical protein CMB80_28945 [Flammeovirgaceae bacterium]|nr:hypothetical protein [Flammeovirgaceae bacterium]MBR10867.1 hypothetical protein [Rickettsiales bacterium]|tara:strand:- start:610 stop:1212 length:603 start_codon:yes stop_codon:yes gene_type:complete